MATVNERVVLSQQPDKLVLLAEIPAAAGSCDAEPTVTFRLLVKQSYGYGDEDVDTMEDVTCRVPLRDMGCRAAVDKAFAELVAKLDNPMLRPEAEKAAARVWARCEAVDELGGVEFRLRVTLIDAFDESAASEDDEGGSDMEFGEFDLHGARKVHYQSAPSYEDDDDDEDGCGAQFFAHPYNGALVREGRPSDGTLLLSGFEAPVQKKKNRFKKSGFEARSDGPEITDQHELTSWDVQRLVHMALDGGGSMEEDEAYQRALLAGSTPLSRASRAAMLDQGLQSARQQEQSVSANPMQMFPMTMRTGF